MNDLWFKVICNGQSIHGGHCQWSLPKDGQPGDWHCLSEGCDPVLCQRGFHVTKQPPHWMDEGVQVYVAEIRGPVAGPNSVDEDATKVAAKECRLLRLATDEELARVGVFRSGTHTCREPKKHWAFGNATVKAFGNATVEAFGNATVEANDNATVKANDNATVKANGNATVKANGNATVIVTRWAKPKVTLDGRAAEVSWVSGWAEFRRAAGPIEETSPAKDAK